MLKLSSFVWLLFFALSPVKSHANSNAISKSAVKAFSQRAKQQVNASKVTHEEKSDSEDNDSQSVNSKSILKKRLDRRFTQRINNKDFRVKNGKLYTPQGNHFSSNGAQQGGGGLALPGKK